MAATLCNASAFSSLGSRTIKSPVAIPPLAAVNGKRRVACKAEKQGAGSVAGPLVATAVALHGSMMDKTNVAMALVDDRMSTEGTGLGLGVSSPLLGWILVGVFGLIWTLYVSTYTNVQEDDEGLSL